MSEFLHTPTPDPITLEPDKAYPRLPLISNLLQALHEHGIIYCHWKSNEHLNASMAGDTDLDILFAPLQKESTEMLLEQLGFKKFVSIKEKQYKDIEDYLGLDLHSGKVVHVHAHFRLTMGEMYLKGYQLNLEDQILGTRIYNDEFGIYCSSPAYELILLYFREALKIRTRDILMMYLQKSRMYYTGNALVEYKWLKQRAPVEEIEAILKSIFVDHRQVFGLVTGEFNRKQLLKLAAILKRKFSDNRLYTPLTARLMRLYREVTVRLSRKFSRFVSYPVTAQRVNPRGGIVVAVVGADGSGKSTVTANLNHTFRQKLDVYRIYFGRGDGKKSWLRQILDFAKTLLRPTKYKTKQNNLITKQNGAPKGIFKNIFKCVEALVVANEKYSNLKRMQKARQKGMLVLCDRFPQNQVMGYNDGPLLHYLINSGNPVYRAIARAEARVYALAEQNPPDILFKLIADASIVEARKPGETSLEKLEAKIEGIKNLHFGGKCKVVTIDASQPLETVLANIKEEIWSTYN